MSTSTSFSSTSSSAPQPGKPQLKGAALASVISALLLSLLLEALDQTVVGTAMPRIIAQLHGLDRYTWVVTGYVLASMTMIPVVGKLSDQFGRKWFLLGGTALFLLGSLLAGTSQTMNQLIAFRVLQGVGAGMGMALVATIFGDLFEAAERAKWMSVFGIVYGVSNLFGPALGGWLAENGPLLGGLVTESSRWRWVFYVNLPIGLLAVLALLIFLPSNLSERTMKARGWASVRHIDVLGAVLSATATICLLLGLTWGSSQMYAWSSPQVLAGLLIGIVLFGLFLLTESKAEEPILPLALFRNQVFSAAAVLSVLQMMILMGLALYLPLFLQGVLGISPTAAGLAMTPLSICMVISGTGSGALVGVLKRYQLIAILAALIMTLGCLLIVLMSASTSLGLATLFMMLVGLGCGVFFTLPMLAAQNALPVQYLGVSTAATRYLGQLGAILGIAIVGTAVNSAISGDLLHNLPTDQAGKHLLSHALQLGFLAVLAFAIIAVIATIFLKDIPFGRASSPDVSGSE
ncbi:MFS transporter [Ktedonosporobacter rubrisoli]|uniref:MFS transporter n=1 Tax=Ktedonosporobacter rubrisoli TaxID=2509675 RepID=A0A4P6JLQ5_KTERU|nr:MFS transporter [Ktedonosporobacter rubrisoli]QBD76145.1 MFS transporter [Ktedonosporobacter rubrisoli]